MRAVPLRALSHFVGMAIADYRKQERGLFQFDAAFRSFS